jgi:predicted RNase H-like HicB family nuclease
MKRQYTFTAHVEKDAESGLYYGYIPSLPGAHTQAETLDELHANLAEVAELCLEELSEEEYQQLTSRFIGTQQVSIAI